MSNKITISASQHSISVIAAEVSNGTLAQGTSGTVYLAFNGKWVRLSDGADWGSSITARILPFGSVLTLEVI